MNGNVAATPLVVQNGTVQAHVGGTNGANGAKKAVGTGEGSFSQVLAAKAYGKVVGSTTAKSGKPATTELSGDQMAQMMALMGGAGSQFAQLVGSGADLSTLTSTLNASMSGELMSGMSAVGGQSGQTSAATQGLLEAMQPQSSMAQTLQGSGNANAWIGNLSTYGADTEAILNAMLAQNGMGTGLGTDSGSGNAMLDALLGGNSGSNNPLNTYLNGALQAATDENQALVESFQRMPDAAKEAVGLDPKQPVTMEALREIFGADYGKKTPTTTPSTGNSTIGGTTGGQTSGTIGGTTGGTVGGTSGIVVGGQTSGQIGGQTSGTAYVQPETHVTVVEGREYYTTRVEAPVENASTAKLQAESTMARAALMRRGKVEPREMGEGPSQQFYETAASASQVRVDGQVVTPKMLMQQVEAPIVAKAQAMYATNETSSTSEFTIKLAPDGLGEIIVNMKNEGGKLSISMFAENGVTSKLLNSQLGNIRHNLATQDVRLDFIEVRAGSEAFGGNLSGSFMNFSANQNQGNNQGTQNSAGYHGNGGTREVEEPVKETVYLPEDGAVYI